ncbi:hypothetical protein PG994_005959 [Apiospora phragmitis]|uniref:Protein kinase domain-containing protein n=1 Tax=Apiospora phragmitis TaxID=2905665 RepID=A0ABR1VDP7_9PEZI
MFPRIDNKESDASVQRGEVLVYNKPPYRRDASELSRQASKYDFTSETSPGIWKVVRKSDRAHFLARDVSSWLLDHGSAAPSHTSLLWLLDNQRMIEPLMAVLNHENLVNFVDWAQLIGWKDSKQPDQVTHFFIYDYCNAGTLENLFQTETRVTPSGNEARYKVPVEHNRFLPESLCWHVVCSILKGLAWLHDGIREDLNPDTKEYEIFDAGLDWQTILHRDIIPANIFFCHPHTMSETYGQCKLGNLSKAFVSGHVNGVLGGRVPPGKGKVLAGQDGFEPLEKLRQKKDMPMYHPPQFDQPYTIISEYRSAGDVLMGMMIKPIMSAMKHMEYIRDRNEKDWNEMFSNANYSADLKDLVWELMSRTELEHQATFDLYLRAKEGFQNFRETDRDGKAMVTIEHVQVEHAEAEAERRANEAELTRRRNEQLDKEDDKIRDEELEAPCPNPTREKLLREIAELIQTTSERHEGRNRQVDESQS